MGPQNRYAVMSGSATNNKFPKTHKVSGVQPIQTNYVRGVALLLLMTADPTHLKPGMHRETYILDMKCSANT